MRYIIKYSTFYIELKVEFNIKIKLDVIIPLS